MYGRVVAALLWGRDRLNQHWNDGLCTKGQVIDP
jgi:hypothetical protein